MSLIGAVILLAIVNLIRRGRSARRDAINLHQRRPRGDRRAAFFIVY